MPKKQSTTKSISNPFIVIEALDAGGSQTQTNLLVRHFRQAKYQVLPLHFPQEDRLTGRVVYDKFLHRHNDQAFTRREQALLYIMDFYSRAEDITQVKQQKRGKHAVITDRFCTSTFAYQTLGLTGKTWDKTLAWLEWMCYADQPALPRPDLIIFIDTPVAITLDRLAAKKTDYFENKKKLEGIRRNYLKVAAQQNWHLVSGVTSDGRERTRPDIAREIWQIVADQLHLPHA